MAVVAQHNDGADRWLRSVVRSGRPLDGSVMQTAANIGAITLKDGSAKAKVQLLTFDGDAYGVFAFVDPVLLLLGSLPLWSGRLLLSSLPSRKQRLRSTQHEAESADAATEAVQRCAATK